MSDNLVHLDCDSNGVDRVTGMTFVSRKKLVSGELGGVVMDVF
jgi:hypothetical protein